MYNGNIAAVKFYMDVGVIDSYSLKLVIVIRVSREHFKSRKKMKGKKRVQRKIKGGGIYPYI